jgi:hypothetical protein
VISRHWAEQLNTPSILVDMIIVTAVLETDHLIEFTSWPIMKPPGGQLLALSDQMSHLEVGTAIAIIFDYGDIPAEPITELHHLLDQHLVEAEALLAPGGLRFHDSVTKAEFVPGCCFGLESWREW